MNEQSQCTEEESQIRIEFCRVCANKKETEKSLTYCDLEKKSISLVITDASIKCPIGNW